MLNIKSELPRNFTSLKVEHIHEVLGGPTLFHLEQGRGQPLFISVLLHGNEHSGFLAIQKLMAKYQLSGKELERPLLLFIGNTEAAAVNKRLLAHQQDFNRIWSSDHEISHVVMNSILDKNPICCVDIHNNTGNNPFYSCVNLIEDKSLQLARFFSETMVYFTEPHEVLSMAMSRYMPSITIEAGRSGEPEGIETLVRKLEVLFKQDIFHGELKRDKLTVLHTLARMTFADNTNFDFSFSQNQCQFSFLNRIDEYNFKKLSPGTVLAKAASLDGLIIERSDTKDPLNHFFKIEGGELKVAHEFIPAMITKNIENIHADCFGYIMEPFPL